MCVCLREGDSQLCTLTSTGLSSQGIFYGPFHCFQFHQFACLGQDLNEYFEVWL